MKALILSAISLISAQAFACEPYKTTKFYEENLDAQNFVYMGTDMTGKIHGEILKRETTIRSKQGTRAVQFSFLEAVPSSGIVTTKHRITISSVVNSEKGDLFVTQNIEVKNSFSEGGCERLQKAGEQIISGTEIMQKFSGSYISGHIELLKNTADVFYDLRKFAHLGSAKKALEKELEDKNLAVSKDSLKANYQLTLEVVGERPLTCSVKGELVSQKKETREKTLLELPTQKAFTCAKAVRRLIQNTMPQN